YIALKFWKSTGLLYAIHNKERDMIETLNQEFYFYEGQDNVGRNSGAYVFRPKHPTTKRVGLDAPVTVRVVKGPLVQEVHQTFCPWVSQVVRLYKGAKYAEFQWIVGPIDTEDGQGKEVVSLFTSNLQNDRIFYTDSNGREMLERVQDMRETWDYRAVDPISGNYYPVTSRIYIQDRRKDVQLSVVTDRPQGGTSLGTGLLELMVHRRLLRDDGLGVDEPLNDEGVDRNGIIFTGKHYVVLDTIANSAKLLRHLALQVHLEPTVMFTPVTDKKPGYKMMQQQTFLTNPLPDNVHILTLDRISANETNFYLLRLEHVYEADGPPESSAPAHVTLENLFKPFDIYWAEETTLGGNYSPDDVDRLQWTTNDGDLTDESINSPDFKPKMEPPFNIILHPMEIRTFRVQIVKY
ncbi:lysosomal alpha-mannosidase-like, partial [Physella acuta]|uniref:lysosomal alpha-mannosidase-like n=1 Tax=Physella acuta TaxID=109671 RepID=UPI0027DBE3AA